MSLTCGPCRSIFLPEQAMLALKVLDDRRVERSFKFDPGPVVRTPENRAGEVFQGRGTHVYR